MIDRSKDFIKFVCFTRDQLLCSSNPGTMLRVRNWETLPASIKQLLLYNFLFVTELSTQALGCPAV